MNITKLGIGMPTSGLCEARTAFSLAASMQSIRVPSELFLAIGCYIHVNREQIAEMALKSGCSHLFFVDSDVMFNHQAIAKLMEHDVEIVGARYNKKTLPLEPIVKAELNGQMAEVPFLPTGFMLINCDVFKKIGKPYFSHQDAESEDVYFCEKAKANGYKLYCDPTIQIGHLGTAMF